MNNLTQTKQDAKQAYLNHQSEQMLALYKQADKSERNAIIKQIDNFLEVINPDEKSFWLKFRRKLEVLNEPKPLFSLGQVVITVGAREVIEKSNQLPIEFLQKHQTGNFGNIGKEDWQENLLSIKNSYRILSAYKTTLNEKIWVITEADRSSTCLLLPEEY